jgi:hypothetical protein
MIVWRFVKCFVTATGAGIFCGDFIVHKFVS